MRADVSDSCWLQAIAAFKWRSGIELARLAEHHLCSGDEMTRTHAALAVMRAIDIPCMRRGSKKEQTASMLERVVVVGVADKNEKLRATLLTSLGSRVCFLSVLKRPHLIRLLASVLKDSSLEVRRSVVPILGQLAPLNPSVVMGSVQKTIKSLIKELVPPDRSYSSRHKIESVMQLLGDLVLGLGELIGPYKGPLVHRLLKILDSNPSSRLVEHTMRTLGSVAQVVGESLSHQVVELVDVVVKHIDDLTRYEARVASLEALSQIVSGTGFVVTPYEQHPELHRLLLDCLQPAQPWPVRRAAAEALGVIGALDPKHIALTASKNYKETNEVETPLPPKQGTNEDKLTSTVVEKAVCLVLQDPQLGAHHNLALRTACTILKCLGNQATLYLERLVPLISHLFKEHSGDGKDSGSNAMLRQMCSNLVEIVDVAGPLMRPYLVTVFGIIVKLFPTGFPEVDGDMLHILAVMSHKLAISCAGYQELQELLPQVLPQLVRILQLMGHRSVPNNQQNDTEASIVYEVLCTFAACGAFLNSYVHVVMPSIIRLAGSTSIHAQTRAAFLCALASYSANCKPTLDFHEGAPVAAGEPLAADHFGRRSRVCEDPSQSKSSTQDVSRLDSVGQPRAQLGAAAESLERESSWDTCECKQRVISRGVLASAHTREHDARRVSAVRAGAAAVDLLSIAADSRRHIS